MFAWQHPQLDCLYKHVNTPMGWRNLLRGRKAALTNSQETWGWKVLVLRKNAIKRDSVCVLSAYTSVTAQVYQWCQSGLLMIIPFFIIEVTCGGYVSLKLHTFLLRDICLESVAPSQRGLILPCKRPGSRCSPANHLSMCESLSAPASRGNRLWGKPICANRAAGVFSCWYDHGKHSCADMSWNNPPKHFPLVWRQHFIRFITVPLVWTAMV